MADLEPVYSLQEAVTKVLRGRWTVASLRTEIRKGRLRPIRIAGKLGVTDSALGEMLKLCQDEPKAQDYALDLPVIKGRQRGSLSIEDRKQALDAARATAKALKARLPVTSLRNTSRRAPTDA